MASVNYRDYLKRSFEKRQRKQPGYTLQAFSLELGLRKGEVSDLLNRRYGLSISKAQTLVHRMDFESPDDKEKFLLMVESEHSRSLAQRQMARRKLNQFSSKVPRVRYEDQIFSLISNWYHLAICELSQKENFKLDPKWIAGKLRLSLKDAKSAVERLLALKVLKRDEKGKFVAEGFGSHASKTPSTAIRKYHREILALAQASIDGQDMEKRDLSAINFLVHSKDIPAIKERLKEFRRELAVEFSSTDAEAEVFCLSTQLFQMSWEEEG